MEVNQTISKINPSTKAVLKSTGEVATANSASSKFSPLKIAVYQRLSAIPATSVQTLAYSSMVSKKAFH